MSGLKKSVAGYLNLTKIQQLGTGGTPLNAPVTTMTYIEQTQHYIDKAYYPAPYPTSVPTNCGPSWTPHDSKKSGNPCVLWAQNYNSYYLATLDNGMGWHATMTWQEAHNNTHGNLGDDPFTCDAPGAQTPTSLCGEADDGSWSRVVLTKRVEQTNGVSSTWSYQYHLTALTALPCPDCNYGYTWGLASWTAPGGTTGGEQYLYDNEGNRVLQRSSTTSGGNTAVTDTITFDKYTDTVISNGTTSTTKYYSAGGQRVAEATGTAWYYLISDLLGSTVLALKGDGTFQAAHLFAPYGQVRYSDGTIPTPHNFTGQRLDVGTGLLYYGARYYDPIAGTFTSTDSLQGNDQGLNPYGYAYGNPETYSDPSGHVPFPEVDPEAWEQFWKNLALQAPGLALWFFLNFAPGGNLPPPTNGSSLQGPPGPSDTSDTAPSDSKTIDPGTEYDAGKVPEKGSAKDSKGGKGGKDKRGSREGRNKIDRARGDGNPTPQVSGSPGSGWRGHTYQPVAPQVQSYTHPPVTIDITPVSFYLPPSVSQPYTPSVVAPTPDPSWWSQAISWATDTWDQFTSWASDTWEEDSQTVEEGLSWVADTFGWLA